MKVTLVRNVNALRTNCPAMKKADMVGILLDIQSAIAALGAGGNSAEGVAMFNGLKATVNELVDLTNDLKAKYNAAVTLINELKSDHNAHCANTTSHSVADATNTTSSANSVATAKSDAVAIALSDIPATSVSAIALDLGNASK